MCFSWCDRGGNPRRVSEENDKRKRARKICDFNIEHDALDKMDGLRPLIFIIGEHNHSPTLDCAGHSAARRLNKQQKLEWSLTSRRVCPQTDFDRLDGRKPGPLAHATSIYYEQVRVRKRYLNRRVNDRSRI